MRVQERTLVKIQLQLQWDLQIGVGSWREACDRIRDPRENEGAACEDSGMVEAPGLWGDCQGQQQLCGGAGLSL